MEEKPNLMELVTKQEPLDPELKPYLQKGRLPGGLTLHHPFMIELFVDPERCGLINYRYKYKSMAILKAIQDKKYATFIFLHERPYRLQALIEARNKGLSGGEYWDLVGNVWVDTENLFQHLKSWKKIWSEKDAHRDFAMNEDEREKLKALPDEIKVYRGTKHIKSIQSLSWTLDEAKAIWFAKRWPRTRQKPRLVTGLVQKSNIYAMFLGRNEEEIVSNKVKIIRVNNI